MFTIDEKTLGTYHEALGETLGAALLRPTKIYVKALRSVKEAGVKIHGCSHVTGGGFYENVPRMLPEGVKAVIHKDSYRVPEIFRMLQKEGDIEEKIMYNTYNMGVGMSIVVAKEDVDTALAILRENGDDAYIIGEIIASDNPIIIE